MNKFPFTPPPELVEQWETEACPECRASYDEFTGESVEILVTRAAQWGADQELEACVKLLELSDKNARDFLYSARRPKPPSLKEQALDQLSHVENRYGVINTDYIRRALEQLDD